MYRVNDLYDQIVIRLGINLKEQPIGVPDVIQAIGDAVKTVRGDYISKGILEPFAITEKFILNVRDDHYPHLLSETMCPLMYQSIPAHQAIVNCLSTASSIVLKDQLHTFSKETLVVFEDGLYKAMSDIESVNTYGKTFYPLDVREYSPGNLINYHKNDVVYDPLTDAFYRFTASTIMTGTVTDEEDIEQVFWLNVGRAYKQPNVVSFKNIAALNYYVTEESPAIAIKNDTLYATKHTRVVVLTYVPEFTEVYNLSDTLDIPDFAVEPVIVHAMRTLAVPLNINLPEPPDEPKQESA